MATVEEASSSVVMVAAAGGGKRLVPKQQASAVNGLSHGELDGQGRCRLLVLRQDVENHS